MTWRDLDIDVNGKRSGQIKTHCPKCHSGRSDKRDKSLSVNLTEGVANCHYCNATFTINDRQRMVYDRPKKTYVKPEYHVQTAPLNEKLAAHLAKRGITPDVIERHKLEVRRVWMPQSNQDEWAIAFPYFRDGEVVNVKYRTIKEKNFRLEKNAEPILYGLDDIDPEKPLIIVEGEFDKLAMEVAGFRNCVSVPNGAGSNLDDCLGNVEGLLSGLPRLVVAGDNDEAGRRLSGELIRRLGAQRCYRVSWPDDCKDANEVLVKHGAAILRACVESAEALPIDGAFEINQLAQEILDLYELGIPQGVTVGWDNVTQLYRPRAGETTYVTGIPSSGKSAWLSALLVNLAKYHNWKFAVFPAENLPLAQYASQLMEIYTGKPFTEGPTLRMSQPDVLAAMAWLQEHFFLMYPADGERKLIDILAVAEKLIFRWGINGLVIDPWNELDHQITDNSSDYTGQQLSQFRQFTRQRQIHGWIVAHPTKLKKETNGQYPTPTLYDIAGSAHWYNKADNGIVICRDKFDDSKPIELHVQKVRFRYSGQLGSAELYFDKATGRYFERPDFTRHDDRKPPPNFTEPREPDTEKEIVF